MKDQIKIVIYTGGVKDAYQIANKEGKLLVDNAHNMIATEFSKKEIMDFYKREVSNKTVKFY